MRKLIGLLAAAALVLGAAGQASAATSNGTGVLNLGVSALPAITVIGDDATATNIGGVTTVGNFDFGPTNVTIPKSLFTGVPSISGLTVVSLGAAGASNIVVGAAGQGPLAGTAIVNVLQFAGLPVPLSVVGVSGASATAALGAIAITVTGNGWTTGVAVLTGITTGTPNGGNTNTVSMSGARNTVGDVGQVVLVTPAKAITSVAGTLPLFATITLNFVPEPGTLLLVGSGVAGLALIGRRRTKK